MKYRSYFAINLMDSHKNQVKGESETTVNIKFILAKNLDAAKRFVHRLYPDIAWFVIPKKYCDANIVYANISDSTSERNSTASKIGDV